ncbi:hypothetical protein GJ496_007275 [Pomphorhynchus laevis]|nr:hypothetical protein GJ496_007275 [Pomphorhynchus laevis]
MFRWLQGICKIRACSITSCNSLLRISLLQPRSSSICLNSVSLLCTSQPINANPDQSAAFKYVFQKPSRKRKRFQRIHLDIVSENDMFSHDISNNPDSLIEIPSTEDIQRESTFTASFMNSLNHCQTLDDMKEVITSLSGNLSSTMLIDSLEKFNRMFAGNKTNLANWYFSDENRQLRSMIESSLDIQSASLTDNTVPIVVRFLLAVYRLDDTSDTGVCHELINRDFPASLVDRMKKLPMSQLIACTRYFNLNKPIPTHPIGQLVLQSLLDQIHEQIELRQFELVNLRQCSKLVKNLDSRDDKLLKRLDDHVLNLLNTKEFELDDVIFLLTAYAQCQRRNRPILNACVYLIGNSSYNLGFLQIVDCFEALSRLQLFDEIMISKLISNLSTHLVEPYQEMLMHDINNLIISFGRLRLRHEEIFDQFWLYTEQSENLDLIKSLLFSLAIVNYVPTNFRVPDISYWKLAQDKINMLWSLACLNIAEKDNFENVITDEVIDELTANGEEESAEMWKLAALLKLLQLHNYYQMLYLTPEEISASNFRLKVDDISELITVKNKQLISEVRQLLDQIGNAGELYKSLVVTKSGLIIDFLLVVNQDNEPQNLKFYIQRTSSQKNKMIIPNHLTKIALKCLDFHDRTLCSGDFTGSTYLYANMIEMQGYKCIFIDRSLLSSLRNKEEKHAYISSLINVQS